MSVASVNIPAGRWLVRATATAVKLDGSVDVRCFVISEFGDNNVGAVITTVDVSDPAASPVYLVGVVTTTAAGPVWLKCQT